MSSRTAFVIAVLAASLPLSIQAHDIYSHLRDQSGTSCCNDRDCRRAPLSVYGHRSADVVDARWIEIPSDKIQYIAIPGDTGETGGGHWCGLAYEPSVGPLYITHCAILPPQSASVH